MRIDMPYGFTTASGYKGRLPDGSWMFFPTQREYAERFREELSEAEAKGDFQNPGKSTTLKRPALSVI